MYGVLRRRAAATLAVATCASAFGSAYAQLGGSLNAAPSFSTTASDQPIQTLFNGAVRMRQFTDAGLTTLREYASADGRIFAVTWSGPTMPDLRALLGSYWSAYRAQAASDAVAGVDLHASRVVQRDVIVESGGQMRSYLGRAWLPAALPAGVVPDDLN